MKKYLLPCSCGQTAEVDTSQAGLTIKCACGANLEVPTMRGLSQLKLVESATAPAASQSAWGPGQGLMFVGVIVLLCGLIALALVWRTRPQWMVHEEQIATNIDRLPVGQLWELWQNLRKGLSTAEDPIRQRFEADWATYRRRQALSAIPIVVGLLMLVGGFFMRRPAHS